MSKNEPHTSYPHESKDDFQAALEYTQGATGFRSELIEKDYFCSLVLGSIFTDSGHGLVFKGGTCLNKVYMGFFRLSEDLDFSVPISPQATRTARSRQAQRFKKIFGEIEMTIPGITTGNPLAGANNSTQYVGELLYESRLSNDPGRIKIEIGLREELYDPPASALARTLVQDPFSRKPLIGDTSVRCLSLREAMAEKIRAMFTRKEIAIRDFFDYWHAQNSEHHAFDESDLLRIAIKKVQQSTTPYVSLTAERLRELNTQLTTDLRPVLTESAFQQFPLKDAISLAQRLEVELMKRLI